MLALAVIVAALVGYWRMRRWGVWLLALAVTARAAASLSTTLPLRPADLAVPVILLAAGLGFVQRLR